LSYDLSSRFDLQKLKTRAITAIVVAPICLLIIYFGGWPFLLLMAAGFVIAQYEWFVLARKIEPFLLYYLPGVAYLVFCFYCFYLVGAERSFAALLLLLLVISSDVGAYFAGKMIGGPKMARKISPNKTWAGLVGAVIAPAAVLLLAEILFLDYLQKSLWSYILFFVFGCILGLFCQLGDILVSWIKRRAAVKDTGNLLPGHGGLLDRIDALLLASPMFIVLEYIFGHV
jgi:phosphatidate cytidylyltransferase